MLPSLSIDNVRNRCPSDVELFGEASLVSPSFRVGTDVVNISLRQSGTGMTNTNGGVQSIFRPTIKGVVSFGAEEEMVGVDTGWGVASMKNTHIGRDVSYVMSPRKSMCSFISTIDTENAVTELVGTSIPNPTGIGFGDVREESFNHKGILSE